MISMTGPQWFELWMTLLGLAGTVVGVYGGARLALRHERKNREAARRDAAVADAAALLQGVAEDVRRALVMFAATADFVVDEGDTGEYSRQRVSIAFDLVDKAQNRIQSFIALQSHSLTKPLSISLANLWSLCLEFSVVNSPLNPRTAAEIQRCAEGAEQVSDYARALLKYVQRLSDGGTRTAPPNSPPSRLLGDAPVTSSDASSAR